MTKSKIESLNNALNALNNGDASIVRNIDFQVDISLYTTVLINSMEWTKDEQEAARLILEVSNIMYNNMSDETLILDDGVYDQLLEKYKKYAPTIIGAKPINFNEITNDGLDEKIMVIKANKRGMHFDDINKQIVPFEQRRPVNMCIKIADPISKRLINVEHKYPELVGTLDKCKFVLNYDAEEAGVLGNDTVKVFERDFIHKIMNAGIINPNEKFDIICELKYDGVSIEAEVQGDTIISALSRGDTADNIAADLTPIFGGYRFPFASNVPKDEIFGIKFEAVVTKRNMDILSNIRGKAYKNCRNCIIGILGASDAYKYIDYITLIPLSTSLSIDRIDELNFLNHFYHSGEYNRWMLFHGNYMEILFQVKQFTESAEAVRLILPYMIDGVVVSLIDPLKIEALGRENYVNKYQMAIKFNPKKVRTIFTGYTFSIGKTGEVIPMAHFKPCEFIGAIHDKQTIHSYQRFKELNLIKGQEIDIEYRNDVITYITKPDTEYNRNIIGEPEKFLEDCPSCGQEIIISPTGKSARCANPYCAEANVMRITDMINKLGFKDFSEQTVRILGIKSLVDLLNIQQENIAFIGPVESMNFMNAKMRLLNSPIEDWRLLSAIGFPGIADEKWKLILRYITYREIIDLPEYDLQNVLLSIKSIGQETYITISTYRFVYDNDLKAGLGLNIIDSKGQARLPKVSFTGFRNQELIDLLRANGFDAGEYGVTNETVALIAADPNATSGKLKKARDKGIPIYTVEQFLEANKIKL